MNQGFFTTAQTQSVSRPDGKSHSCASCGLYKGCKNPKMKPYGDFKKWIMNIGEAPGEIEDKLSKPWQGRTGRALQNMYARLGIDLFKDCININACACRPKDEEGGNRNPINAELDACRHNVIKAIQEYQPKVIVLFGNAAVYSCIGHRWKKDLGGISKWRGWTIPDQDFKAWICPTYHPSFIERSKDKVEEVVWRDDLKQALSLVDVPFKKYKRPEIEIITDLSPLYSIKSDLVAFDYETTGLKPHASGHRIVCTSVADSEDHCFVFMMPETKKERKPFIDLLANPKIDKIAHNMKFEHCWSEVRLKQSIDNWWWDSMIAAHIIDNRPGVTGLKFQTYVQMGLIDYSSEIEPYLQAGDGSGNGFNKVLDLVKAGGKEKLMVYCAMDAINEFRLAMQQIERIGYGELPF